MPRSTSTTATKSRRTAAQVAEEAGPAEPVGLELAGVGLCLASVLLLAALLTFGATDGDAPFRNVAGSAGRGVAGALLRALGIGTWALPAFGVAWGLACLRGRRPRVWGRRALLLVPVVLMGAVLGALVLGRARLPGLVRYGAGGYLGVAVGTGLFRAFGKAAGLVALVGFLGSLRFAADVAVRDLVRAVRGRFGGGGVAAPDLDEEEDEAEVEDEDDEEAWLDGEEEDEEDEEDGDEAGEEEETPAPTLRTPTAPPPATHYAPPAASRPTPARRVPRRRRAGEEEPAEYVFPSTELLEHATLADPDAVREEVEANARVLSEALASFGVEARVVSSQRGPAITFYELAIASGVRLNRVTALADDLAIALKAPSVRIVAPIPGRSTVGVEVPNLTRDAVVLRDLIETAGDALDRKAMPIFLGRDGAGRPIIEDLSAMPHLLIAGATGSGKSVCVNSILLSIVYTRTPDETKLILIDPKQVELSFFEGIPHLMTPVVTDMKRAAKILEWATLRMEERYTLLLSAGVRNIAGYNALSKERIAQVRERTGLDEDAAPDQLPRIVIVVDELADLMMTSGKDVEHAITRLAQKSRAVGIHVVLATQRPSTDVITGLIKANMPTRIAFRVSSKVDSRVILDANGSEKLLGCGDMLYMHPRSMHLRRAQGTLVTDAEARAVVDFLIDSCPPPDYQDLLAQDRGGLGDPMKEDELYDDAVRVVLTTRLGSASMLQRRMGIGYTRASRLVDMMCDHGVVGPHVGSKAREVLLTLEEWEASHPASDTEAVDDDELQDESWE